MTRPTKADSRGLSFEAVLRCCVGRYRLTDAKDGVIVMDLLYWSRTSMELDTFLLALIPFHLTVLSI